MNVVKELRIKADNVANDYAKKIGNYIQEEVNKVDDNIKIVIANHEINRIYVRYFDFQFSFTYTYFHNGKLHLRGYISSYKCNDLEKKTRKVAYTFCKEILKGILEKENE